MWCGSSPPVTCAPRLKETDAAFDALIAALNSLEWPTQVDTKAEVFVDRERLTATVGRVACRFEGCPLVSPVS